MCSSSTWPSTAPSPDAHDEVAAAAAMIEDTGGFPTAASVFADILRTRQRGKLKLYVGSAAGSGKTFRMLGEAHALSRRGVDVVVGFVESHGRAETEAPSG